MSPKPAPATTAPLSRHASVNESMHRTFSFHLKSLRSGIDNLAVTAAELLAQGDSPSPDLAQRFGRQITAVVAYSGLVQAALIHHHHNEDVNLFDPLQAGAGDRTVLIDGKFEGLSAVIGRLEGQHGQLHDALENFASSVQKLETGTPSVPAAQVASTAVEDLHQILAAHCGDEEKVMPQLEKSDFAALDKAVRQVPKDGTTTLTALMHVAGEKSPVPAPIRALQHFGPSGTKQKIATVQGYLHALGISPDIQAAHRSSATHTSTPGGTATRR